MQTPAPQAPTPIAPSARPTIVVQDGPGGGTFSITTPMSAREVAAIKAQREELSNQLESVDGRRSRLLSQLRQTADPTAIKGLEDRLALLDKRQLQLESDIATTGQQLTSAPAGLAASTGTPGGCGSWVGSGGGNLDCWNHLRARSADNGIRAHDLEESEQAGPSTDRIYRDRSATGKARECRRHDRGGDRANLRGAALRHEASFRRITRIFVACRPTLSRGAARREVEIRLR